MGTNLHRWCGAAGVLLVIASGAQSNAAKTEEESKDLTPTARDLSDQGLRQYQRGELDAAIESFMEAFALSNNSGLLFNIAQAFRLKGDCARAKDYYRRYLDAAPESALKPSVERRLDEQESCLKARTAAAGNARPALEPRDDATTTTARAVALSSGAPPPPSRGTSQVRSAMAWTLRGSAAALLASSVVFGALAWDARRDYDGTSLQRPALEANDRYRRDTTLAGSFAVSGAACGLISYFVGRRP